MEIEIGRGKKARQAYGFDDIAIVPSRRTRDPQDVDIGWKLGPHLLELPLLGSAMDGVISPETAIKLGELGGLGVLNLEGIFSRYEDADIQLTKIAKAPKEKATAMMQKIYEQPVEPRLIARRIEEIKSRGVLVAGSLTPQRVRDHYEIALAAGLDVLVIQGTVVSAEHVSSNGAALNLKEFIAEIPIPVIVGGCASYQTALHLMRTGAEAVLVGVGPGAACTTRGVLGVGVPQATAISDASAARVQHLLETGNYVNVIADGGMRTGGDIAKAIACGADAVMVGSPLARAKEAPGRGYHWGMATFHPTLPARRPRAGRPAGDARADRDRPGDRERRDAEPDGRPPDRDGDLRVRVDPRLPEGRDHAGAGDQDRRQGASEVAADRDGMSAEILPFERTGDSPEDRPVLVVDFGGQYSQLIARRVREARVYSELVSHRTPAQAIRARNPRALILSGGPASVYADEAPKLDRGVWDLGIPTLGICYGMQLMALDLGGRVERTGGSEFGRADLRAAGGALLEDTPDEQVVWMSHRDSVTAPPEDAEVTASSPSTPIAAFEAPERGLYGVQFHPEVVHTAHGQDVLKNFLYGVAEAPPSWTAAAVIEEQVERIRTQVGSERVLCALSGGVDSAVAALLVHKAVGDQLTCVFVDHGLLRKDEAAQVVETFQGHFNVPLVHVEAEERFLGRLDGVEDPEEKRKRVGEEFIRVFEDEAKRQGRMRYLVQGTLYSDVIESGGTEGVAAMIKSHHNVGGLPEDVDFDLVEPLRLLFKDEVRRVGEELGLPERMVWRQPFPGPGLAIRIIGEVTRERLEILREADAILQEEVRRAGLYRDLWQSFAVLPAIRSVGVQGDERTYAYPVVIRAVTSEDAMTADWARLPYDLLETISSRIINEIPGVNRVALDISSKPPSTIEWE